jgi:hypothetical protein
MFEFIAYKGDNSPGLIYHKLSPMKISECILPNILKLLGMCRDKSSASVPDLLPLK